VFLTSRHFADDSPAAGVNYKMPIHNCPPNHLKTCDDQRSRDHGANQGGLMAKNSKGQAKKPKQEKPKTNVSSPSLKGFAATTSGAGSKK
jgi:hypothetical protein